MALFGKPDQGMEIHLIELVARENQKIFRRRLADRIEILPNRISRAFVEAFFSGREHLDSVRFEAVRRIGG